MQRPFLDWSSDADGDSHIVKLLQHAGYIKEVQAKQQPERLPHPKGGARSTQPCMHAMHTALDHPEVMRRGQVGGKGRRPQRML